MAKATSDSANSDRDWARRQIAKYRSRAANYEIFARTLRDVLEQVSGKLAPLAIVQTRPKALSSFADKIFRKRAGHKNPVDEFTDLCGGRVIVHTPEEVKAVSKFIEDHFLIDWENSVDVSQRHRPAEFGYRSVHYIVSFREGTFPNPIVSTHVPKVLYRMENPRAEVQVRTLLEHAWADISHDFVYKAGFKVPEALERELAAVAALLENADNSFSRVVDALRAYSSSFGVYMTPERMQREIEVLDFVRTLDRGNVQVAAKLGKLAISLGDWDRAIEVLGEHAGSDCNPLLRDLGVALCKVHQKDPKSRHYRRGQSLLEKSMSTTKPDIDSIASLAGTWKGVNDEKSRQLYRLAFEADPTDPYALGNYLDAEIILRRDLSVVPMLRPTIIASLDRCRQQARVGVNLPWAFFSMGKFILHLGRPSESLISFAKAIQLSTAAFMIESSMRSIERLEATRDGIAGFGWALRLEEIGLAAKFPTESRRNTLLKHSSEGCKPISGRVVIVAGGCDRSVQEQMDEYRNLMTAAFKDYQGVVISGGTTQGISGLAGDLAEKYRASIRGIGYLPKLIPAEATVDKRYREIRRTDGSGFGPAEPLQNWTDILSAGIDPASVRLLGINGGPIAAFEYRLALALGATVGIIENSGREAAKLWFDEDWSNSPGLVSLPNDPMTVRAFVGPGESPWRAEERERMARSIHERYREAHTESVIRTEPAMVDWDRLDKVFKDSNLDQADHILQKLHEVGYDVSTVVGRKPKLVRFSKAEIERLAQMEHGRWNAERLLSGFKRGEKRDPVKKTSPYLVSWSELPDEVKEWDRAAVRAIPELLASAGYQIRRLRRR
ncbi:MAG: hypothetical protein HYX75_03045 [Acidobacteria bacterium]|nr:hypothetical protein [Acidobacteriota bacterium]